MCRWIWIVIAIVLIGLGIGALYAAEPDAKALAQKGYVSFKDVLAGDEAKLPEAIRLMEDARKADETYVPNLYNLARAYFFEGITFNKEESVSKAEKTFARMIELDPSRMDALAFHGAILAQMSGGRDMAMFMRGAQELKTAGQRNPDDLTVRIVTAFVSQSVPPQALAMIGVADPVGDLKFIGGAFDKFSSEFAPHASVVMNAFIGEGLMLKGDKENARASFERALKVPQPFGEGEIAGRKLLDDAIKVRMKGGEQSIFGSAVFSGCHSCHLANPDKLLPR
jgi:tetratricopeptide (TPR) repeat protein